MKNDPESIEALAKKKSSSLREWLGFLSSTKKWWLLPVLIVLVLLGALSVLSGSVAAPFIYTLF